MHDRYDFEIDRYEFVEQPNDVLLVFNDKPAITIPKATLPFFIQDLELDFSDLPLSNHPHIDSIIQGDAIFLGKGFDGIVFQSLGDIVKISTTTPFNPLQQLHRTPQQAIDHTKKEADILQSLENLIECVLPVEYVEHGGRAWIIKPYLELIDEDQLTESQFHQLENCLHTLHNNGYALGDTLQFGIGRDGNVYFMDLGQASTSEEDKRRDLESLGSLANRIGFRPQNIELMTKEALRLLRVFFITARRFKFDVDKAFEKDITFERMDAFTDEYYSLPSYAQAVVDQDPMKIQLVESDFLLI